MKKLILIFVVTVCAFFLYADVSPWDAWRLGYTCFEQGEASRDRGEYTQALKSFNEALEHYNSVRRARPDWNQRVIARRIADCERECERMKRLLGDSEPTQEAMAETGASALRPASQEVAREMEDIRKQLTEAKAELAALRQSTSAQRNYEMEITQLLRDQRVARERYKLLERRYRDLDLASRQPDRQTEELKAQLLEEKMQTEQLRKQIATLERRRKADDARYQTVDTRRRTVERQLNEKLAEIARLTKETMTLRSAENAAAERQRNQIQQLEQIRRQLAETEKEKVDISRELSEVREKLSKSEQHVKLDPRLEKNLKLQIARSQQAQKSLQERLDKTLSDMEQLKIRLIRLQVAEAARQDLEKSVTAQKNDLKSLENKLAAEKSNVVRLQRQLAALDLGLKEKDNQIKLNIRRHEEERKRFMSELESLKKGKGITVDQRVAALEKELTALQEAGRQSAEKAQRQEYEYKKLTLVKKQLEADLAKAEKKLATDSGAGIAKLRAEMENEREKAAKSKRLLEADIAVLTAQNSKNAAAVAEKEAKIKLLQLELNKKEQELSKVSANSVLADENRKMNEELSALKFRLQKKEGDFTRLNVDFESLKKQNDDFLKAVAQHKTDKNKLEAEIVSLKADLERERRSSGASAGELQRARELKVEVEQDLKNALDRVSQLEKRLSNRESVDLQHLTAARKERKNLSDKISSLQSENIRLKAENDSFRQSETRQKDELTKLRSEQTVVVAERDRLQEDRKKHLTAIGKLAGVEKNFAKLKKDFAALQNENKENKILVEAAKPREAELAQIKLRLAELDQLKGQLSREQRLNEELKMSNRRLEKERGNAIILRSQLNNANKRIGELEPLTKEIAALKKLNSELASAKDLEAELVQARAKLNSFESVRLELDHSKQRIRKLEMEKLEAERQAARARNLATGTQLLTAELESARKTADEMAKDKALREMELARIRSKLNEIPRLEAEIESLRSSKTSTGTKDSVEYQQLKRISEKTRVMSDNLNSLEKENDLLQQELKTLRGENARLRLRAAEAIRLKDVVTRLSDVNKNSGNLTADQKQLLALKQKIAVLEADSAALQKARSAQAKELKSGAVLKEQLVSLRKEAAQAKNLRAENVMLKEQNSRLAELDETKKQLALVKLEILRLKSQAETAERLQKQLLSAETASAEKQAELDRSQRQLAAAAELKKQLLAQKQEASNVQIELARTRSENENIKLQLLRFDALKRELENQKRLTAQLADAKGLEKDLAQAKLKLAEFEQVKSELARVTRYNNELTAIRQRLESELAARPTAEDRLRDQLDMISTRPTGKPGDFIASGKIAEADGSVELAIWNYEQALKIERNNAQASGRLGNIMLERGNYQRAVELLSNARAVDPGNVELACAASSAYIGLKRYGNALAILSPLAQRMGDDYQVQMLLGKALAGSGDKKQAEVRMKMAIRKAPADVFAPRIEFAKFLVESDIRRLDEAARIYESARVAGAAPDIELEPKLGSRLDERREVSGFLANAAREAEKNGDWKTAGWYYKQLVELGRDKERYLIRQAFALYKNGNSSQALELLTFNRTTALGTLLTAMIQLAGKEYPAMLGSARKAVALNGGKPVLIPADWSAFAVEFESLRRRQPAEMAEAVRRAFRIR